MKRLVTKSFLFVFIFSILLLGIDVLSMVPPTNRYIAQITNSSTDRVGSGEIETRLGWVRESDDSTRLIVGDSVGNQLFIGLRGMNEGFCIATSNQAITMAGHYILIGEYIRSHEMVEDVYLVIVPQTLGADINTRLTYQYFVMTFLGNDCGEYLDEDTIEELENKFGAFFLKKDIVRAIDLSCINRKLYLNLVNRQSETGKSESIPRITLKYLVKIKKLCRESGINFHLIPAPVEDTPEKRLQMDILKEKFEESGLDELFPNYFDQIIYYPASQFRDGVHFAGRYSSQYEMNNKIKDMTDMDINIENLRKVYSNQ